MRGAALRGHELGAGVPWAGTAQPPGDRLAVRCEVSDKCRETFLERAALAGGIPDEMSNPQRRELLALVPGSKARDRPIAFVDPDLAPDSCQFRVRQVRFQGRSQRDHNQTDKYGFHGITLIPRLIICLPANNRRENGDICVTARKKLAALNALSLLGLIIPFIPPLREGEYFKAFARTLSAKSSRWYVTNVHDYFLRSCNMEWIYFGVRWRRRAFRYSSIRSSRIFPDKFSQFYGGLRMT